MNKTKTETIKRLDFEKTKITIREAYIDENGHERERERQIEMPIFLKEKLSSIAEKIYKEIKKMPVESEFTIQQFLENYNILEEDKYSLCNLIFEFCKNDNISIEENNSSDVSELPWNISRTKKK